MRGAFPVRQSLRGGGLLTAAPFCRVLAFLTVFFVLCGPVVADSGADIEQLVIHGGVALERDGVLVYARNRDIPLVPASILKIATALVALDLLGPDYRFSTRLFVDENKNLFIRGSGDPFLISEEVARIARSLHHRGVKRVRDIVLDSSAFALETPAPGTGASANPYDALNSGLAVNFNTLNLFKEENSTLRSAEPQTPFLPLMAELGRDLPPGEHRINISASPGDREGVMARHVGELFQELLRAQGIAVTGNIRPGGVPERARPVVTHRSRPLEDMIAPLMRHSNNYVANQLFLACGIERYGLPATWAKARAAVEENLSQRFGFSSGDLVVEEGSGLSRKNRITVQAMLRILDGFRPYAALLPGKKGRLLKSGTLTGVFSYAGYLARQGRLDRVVIILNQKENTRDRVLVLLEEFPAPP